MDQVLEEKQRAAVNPSTLSDLATIYGCCGFFDLCSDQDLMSLSFEKSNPFMDWIGWQATDVCIIKKNFVTWVRPEASLSGTRTNGYIADPCGASAGVDWGSCDFTLDDFGMFRRHGPERNATKGRLRYCEIQPRYRLDGTMITSDAEYDMRLATEVIMQDLMLALITGNAGTPGQFDGLERLVKTGYTNSKGNRCSIMDSIVVDWNSNGMNGGNGITWNGNAIANTWNFVDVLIAAVRRIKRRIRMAPALAAQGGLKAGDMVFVAPEDLIGCVLNAYTCWSVCDGAQYNEVNLQTYEARTFRDRLNGGMYGAGHISVDGYEIHMLPYEWGLIKGPTRSDAYLLVGSIGGTKLISGQFNDMHTVPTDYPEAAYSYTDGGKFLTWLNRTQTCIQRETEVQPRLLMWAPWAQARFQDIKCASVAGNLSPDPWETSFYPETSFISAECPTVEVR